MHLNSKTGDGFTSYPDSYTGDASWYESEKKLLDEGVPKYNPLQDRTKYLPTKLDPSAYTPHRAHPTDAGIDLKTPMAFRLPANSHRKIDTGVHVAIPEGYWGLVISKSGLMVEGITSIGVIDSPYRGSIGVVLYNHTFEDKYFSAGDKISQLIILPCITPNIYIVPELDETSRGNGGFGSTGR